jgi:hypothetical protein
MYEELNTVPLGPCDIEGSARINLRFRIVTFVRENEPIIEAHRHVRYNTQRGMHQRSATPRYPSIRQIGLAFQMKQPEARLERLGVLAQESKQRVGNRTPLHDLDEASDA